MVSHAWDWKCDVAERGRRVSSEEKGGGAYVLWLGLELGLSWLEIKDRSEEGLRGTNIVFCSFHLVLIFFLSSSVFVASHSKSAH